MLPTNLAMTNQPYPAPAVSPQHMLGAITHGLDLAATAERQEQIKLFAAEDLNIESAHSGEVQLLTDRITTLHEYITRQQVDRNECEQVLRMESTVIKQAFTEHIAQTAHAQKISRDENELAKGDVMRLIAEKTAANQEIANLKLKQVVDAAAIEQLQAKLNAATRQMSDMQESISKVRAKILGYENIPYMPGQDNFCQKPVFVQDGDDIVKCGRRYFHLPNAEYVIVCLSCHHGSPYDAEAQNANPQAQNLSIEQIMDLHAQSMEAINTVISLRHSSFASAIQLTATKQDIINQKDTQIASADQQRGLDQNLIQTLEGQIANWQHQFQVCQQQNQMHHDLWVAANATVNEKTQLINDKDNQINALTQTNNSHVATIEQLQATNAQITAERNITVNSLTQAYESHVATITELQREKSVLNSTIADKDNSINSLVKTADDHRVELGKLKTLINNLHSRFLLKNGKTRGGKQVKGHIVTAIEAQSNNTNI